MKPARFDYDAPTSLDEALGLLADHGEEAKVLAGGQSLVPLLNFRLARPDRLIDLNGVDELAYVRADGSLRIGAMTRQAALERADAAAAWPLLGQALHWVGHFQIRNRGTVGGSVAHADPAAELPVACTALDATMHVHSRQGARSVAARDFFVTHLTTTIEPDELLVELELPPLPPGTGTAFEEYARRHGDFALGGAAAVVTLDGSGTCTAARIALLGAAPTPLRASEAEAALVGVRVDEAAAQEVERRVSAAISPTGDIHGSADYRRGLVGALARRAVLAAAARAKGGAA
ncbi:MAG: FAD binding domain-containing protein [Thermoleophilia bacterium]